jgi:AmmeMemoRadiSam system protein A
MEHSPLDELSLADHEAGLLLDLAELAIRACLDGTRFPGPDPTQLPEALQRPCAAFVTLHVAGALNGCIGNLASDDPIGACVSRLAIQAAFEDPRLPPVRHADLAHLHIEVSLLSPRTPVPAHRRDVLIEQLRPFEHGLVLARGRRHAVFLPTVWDQLPHPEQFVDQLLRKAGLPVDRWPDDLVAEVFTTSSIGRHLSDRAIG